MNRKVFVVALLSTFLLIAGTAQACSAGSVERSDYSRTLWTTAFAAGTRTAVAFTPADCKLAIKILTQYERLAQKLGIKISDKRLKELNRKRDSDGSITINDLPAKLRRNFPGYFHGMSLRDIARQCFLTYGIGLPWTGWT